jgi:hypothetical protein
LACLESLGSNLKLGTAAFVYRDGAPEEVIDKVMTNIKANLPLVPGLGLMLLKCHFDRYANGKGQGRDQPTFESVAELADKFRTEVIERTIVQLEAEGKEYNRLFSVNFYH